MAERGCVVVQDTEDTPKGELCAVTLGDCIVMNNSTYSVRGGEPSVGVV